MLSAILAEAYVITHVCTLGGEVVSSTLFD